MRNYLLKPSVWVILLTLVTSAKAQDELCLPPSYNSATKELTIELLTSTGQREFIVLSPGKNGRRKTTYKMVSPNGQIEESSVEMKPNEFIDQSIEEWLWDPSLKIFLTGPQAPSTLTYTYAEELFLPTRAWLKTAHSDFDLLIVSNYDFEIESYMEVRLYYDQNNRLVNFEWQCHAEEPLDYGWYDELADELGVEIDEAEYPLEYGGIAICVNNPKILARNNEDCLDIVLTPTPTPTAVPRLTPNQNLKPKVGKPKKKHHKKKHKKRKNKSKSYNPHQK